MFGDRDRYAKGHFTLQLSLLSWPVPCRRANEKQFSWQVKSCLGRKLAGEGVRGPGRARCAHKSSRIRDPRSPWHM